MITRKAWDELQEYAKAQNIAAHNPNWVAYDPVPGVTEQAAELIAFAPWLFNEQVDNYRYQRMTYYGGM